MSNKYYLLTYLLTYVVKLRRLNPAVSVLCLIPNFLSVSLVLLRSTLCVVFFVLFQLICVFCLLVVLVTLSVPVQVIAWKDSSTK